MTQTPLFRAPRRREREEPVERKRPLAEVIDITAIRWLQIEAERPQRPEVPDVDLSKGEQLSLFLGIDGTAGQGV